MKTIKTQKLYVMIPIEVEVPDDWDAHQIDWFYNSECYDVQQSLYHAASVATGISTDQLYDVDVDGSPVYGEGFYFVVPGVKLDAETCNYAKIDLLAELVDPHPLFESCI
jgi:hypothetical protein